MKMNFNVHEVIMSHSNLKTHIDVFRRNQGLILKPDQVGYYIRNFLIKNYVENVH